MIYNPDIHNRQSIRLPGFDYAQSGFYFVTICAKERGHHDFGKIVDGEMRLSEIGNVTNKCWLEIPKHYPNAQLWEYVVMPNHVHGIIRICSDNKQDPNVRVQDFEPLHSGVFKNKYQHIIPKSLGSIVRGYKIGVRKWCVNHDKFGYYRWKRNFYDRIIRNEHELQSIRKYIKNNIKKWGEDIENEKFMKIITEQERKKHYESLKS
ncbi:hypothetical protein HQ571_04475 [Candidatus Kuenenbacteria bacterium]|nr:hypothetical protein [Candidatus Kuenenbacteria bacterium]